MTGGALEIGDAYINLEPGDPAPHFAQAGLNGDFNLSNLGGGFIAMAFILSSSLGVGKAVLDIIAAHAGIFEGGQARFIAVTYDHNDAPRLKESRGFQVVLDSDGKVARRYGVLPARLAPGATRIQFRPRLIVLDRRSRVVANIELRPDGSDAAQIIPQMEALPALAEAEPALTPPVLIVPRVFPPQLCRQLIAGFEAQERPQTGVVVQAGDRTTVVLDQEFKRRRDYEITEPDLIGTLKGLLRGRLLPEIAKAFQFQVTHVERHLVCRYTAEERGYFDAHRDNTARATAYRRFAATINLNSEYEGGTLSFPEFGPQPFKPPPGGAAVFSCSLLHAVSVVTSGVRYAYLPFFYDDAAVKVLEEGRASWSHSELDQTARIATRI